jgi:hypothetical protein
MLFVRCEGQLRWAEEFSREGSIHTTALDRSFRSVEQRDNYCQVIIFMKTKNFMFIDAEEDPVNCGYRDAVDDEFEDVKAAETRAPLPNTPEIGGYIYNRNVSLI